MLRPQALSRRLQAGLSIVELMVGIAIGLIVVAAATVLVSTQLSENRRLLLETQLQQDLRATADIITRELRRAGTLPDVTGPTAAYAPLSVETMFNEGTIATGSTSKSNCFARELRLPSGAGAGVLFTYAASDADYLPGPYGYKLDNGVILTRLPAPGGSGGACPTTSSPTNGWQPLTDPNVMRVRTFNVTMSTPPTAAAVRLPCPELCPAPDLGGTSCWPKYNVHELLVTIEGEAARDPAVKRAVTTRVRVRADLVNFNDPGSNRVCPG